MRVPPPILIAVCLAVGWALDRVWDWPILPANRWVVARGALSAVLILLGLGAILYCAQQFKRAHTSIEPWRPTSRIITNGAYRYSRNPIYLGFAVAGAGIGLAFNSYWMLSSLLIFVLIVTKFVIEREEEYLDRKFGKVYANYRRATRRWF